MVIGTEGEKEDFAGVLERASSIVVGPGLGKEFKIVKLLDILNCEVTSLLLLDF